MDGATLRKEIIRLTDVCRQQAAIFERVATRYAQSMCTDTDKVQDWREVYLQCAGDIAETVEAIRSLAAEAPKNPAAKLLEAASYFGHGPEEIEGAIALLSEAAALIDGQPIKKVRTPCNEVMMGILGTKPESCLWTLQQWKEEISFAPSTISATEAWKNTIPRLRRMYATSRSDVVATDDERRKLNSSHAKKRK